jgi:signal transduction histidine kinase
MGLTHHMIVAQLPPDIWLYNASDGLSFRDVRFATRDPRGFLWIVNSGIDFYDGQTVTSYNRFDPVHQLPVSNIRSAAGLRDSLIIFSEVKDLFALNMMSGKVKPFAYPEGMDLNFNDLISIADRQHHPNLLLFTRSSTGTKIHLVDRNWKYHFGYEIFNTESFFPKLMRSYANGPEGVLWLIDQDSLHIRRIDSSGTQIIPFAFPVRKPGDSYRIFYDGQSSVFICRNDGMIYVLRDGTTQVEPFLETPYTSEIFFPIHMGIGEWTWIMSDDRLLRLNLSSGAYERYDLKPFGVYNPVFRGSFEDKEDIIWVFTEMGLLQIKPEPKPFLSLYAQSNQSRNAQFREIIPATDNSVYCRIYTAQASLVEVILRDHAPPDTIVRIKNIPRSGLIERLGNHLIYIPSGAEKLSMYLLPDFKLTEIPLPIQANKQFFNQFFIEGDVVYYQDIRNQLTGINPFTGEVSDIPLEKLPLKTSSPWRAVRKFGIHKILVATETSGLLIFDRRDGKLIEEFSDNSPHPISGNYINTILPESDSIVWLGTLGAGINRVNLENGRVLTYTSLDGLASNMVANMLLDDEGNIWTGTFGGLSMLSKADNRFYNYYVKDGISNDEFNYLSAYKSESGQMYMGTISGITLFHPRNIIGTRPLPPVQINRIERYHQRNGLTILEGQTIYPGKSITISPMDNYVEFRFAVPSYRSNNSHIFFSRLIGVDKDWQRLGRNNTIRYQKLVPGDYTLELMASDANGNLTSAPTAVKIHVQQVFYKSFWFVASLLGLLALIAYIIYRYRVRLLQKEHETRTRIASDLHDEVGGSLTGLYLQMQVMEMKASGEEKSRLAKVTRIIDESITKMRDLVWSIDARSDTWDKMIERMKDYTTDTLSPLDIQFTFTSSITPGKHIDAHLKHNLYLIYKEAIHNIAKHSNANKADIRFEEGHNGIRMTIQDNGKSQEKATSSGQGLQNMKMRAERIKGRLTAGMTMEGFEVRVEV